MSDAAHINKTRKFPSSTTAQLEAAVAQYEAGTHPLQAHVADGHVDAMKTEIANRKSGISKAFVTPQVGWNGATARLRVGGTFGS